MLAVISDLTQNSLDLLLAEYADSPRLKNLIGSYTRAIQELETTALDVYQDVLSLDTAVGVQLDLLGRIVIEDRDGKSDTDYRRALRVRVLINISDGQTEELIAVARLFEDLSAAGELVQIQDLQPARMELRIFSTTPTLNTIVETDRRLKQTKAAGVSLSTIVHYAGITGSFKFIRAADYPEKSTNEGFTNVPADVTGGEFAHTLGI